MTDHIDLDKDPVITAWYQAIAGWDAQISELAEKRARAVELIKAAMGDHTEARINGKPVVSWKWSKPGQRIDRDKLESDFDINLADYMIDNTPARPFKILP